MIFCVSHKLLLLLILLLLLLLQCNNNNNNINNIAVYALYLVGGNRQADVCTV